MKTNPYKQVSSRPLQHIYSQRCMYLALQGQCIPFLVLANLKTECKIFCTSQQPTTTYSNDRFHAKMRQNKAYHLLVSISIQDSNGYPISSPYIFEKEDCRIFLSVSKPPLLTPTTDSKQKLAKIRSIRYCKQHLQTGQQGYYSDR